MKLAWLQAIITVVLTVAVFYDENNVFLISSLTILSLIVWFFIFGIAYKNIERRGD